MNRRVAALLLLGLAALALAFFYIRLGDGPVTDLDIALNAIATTAGGWGVTLLLPDRTRRWAIWFMAVVTPIGIGISVLLTLAVPD